MDQIYTLDGKYFNHSIYEAIFHIAGKPILHVADKATSFHSKIIRSRDIGHSLEIFTFVPD